MSILDKLKGIKVPQCRETPVWDGPQSDSAQGGITSSLLSRYFCCRERFRILTMEGLRPADGWNHKLGYGNLWHSAEEALAAGTDWESKLVECAKRFCKQYPYQQRDVEKWHDVCRLQFPLYVQHWAKHPDVTNRTPLLQEQVFHVPYRLPSGRTVHLRGKWDSVDLAQMNGVTGVILQENKTKGRIDQDQITRQLTFDLQTCLYLVALDRAQELDQFELMPNSRAIGVRYNVIRRPLSGGKGDIKQKKATKGSKCPKCKGLKTVGMYVCVKCGGAGRVGAKPAESKDAYHARLARCIADEPQEYFMRWEVRVTPDDVARFRRECLDPALENLCDDHEWWEWCMIERGPNKVKENPFNGALRHRFFPNHFPRHFREPFGIHDPLRDGGSTEVDEYVRTGNSAGLQRTMNLFPELQEA